MKWQITIYALFDPYARLWAASDAILYSSKLPFQLRSMIFSCFLALIVYVSAVRGVSKTLTQCISKYSPDVTFVISTTTDYNNDRIGTNFRYDNLYPLVIVDVKDPKDIRASVLCAAEFHVEVTVMNGGHSFEGASCTNGILLHLDSHHDVISHELNYVQLTIDEEKTIEQQPSFVKIQSGVRLARLYGLVNQINDERTVTSKDAHGVYVVSGGTCPTVGVTGMFHVQ